jgi:hypothetical protein
MVAEVLGKHLFMAIRSRNAGVDRYLRNGKTPFRYSQIQRYTKDKEPEMPEPDMTRAVLPIPDRPHIGLTTYHAKDPNTKFPAIEPLRPPKDAPNVLVVLLDDVGFAASSAFGGPCQTPNFDTLASSGLKYNRFHTFKDRFWARKCRYTVLALWIPPFAYL